MKLLNTIFWSLTILFVFTGFLFKMLHWPGASIALILGFSLSMISMLLYFIFRFLHKKKARLITYAVYLYFIVLGLGISVYEGIKASKYLLNTFIENQQSIDKSSKATEALIYQYGFDEHDELNQKTKAVIKLIRNDKSNLINNSGGYDADSVPLGKDNLDICMTYYAVRNGGANGEKLKLLLKELRSDYEEILGHNHPVLFEEVNDQKNHWGQSISWIKNQFEFVPLSAGLAKLAIIENQILVCQLFTLKHLKTNSK